MKTQRLNAILIIVVAMLLVPLIAMQFTNEVNWSLIDFCIAGVLLFGTGFLIEFVSRIIKTSKYRVLIITLVIVLFLLLWVEMSVGLFGSPLAGN